MIIKYPNISITLLLALIFLAPFISSKLSGGHELYPAVILPSGAMKIDIGQKELRFDRTSLWGMDEKNNSWKRIDDVGAFLSPIPLQYFKPIMKNEFGLNPGEGGIHDLSVGSRISTKKVNPTEVEEGKQWLREKLVKSGYAPDRLRITLEQIRIDVETSQVMATTTNYEKIHRLD